MSFSRFLWQICGLERLATFNKNFGHLFLSLHFKKQFVTKMKKIGKKTNVGHFACVFFSYVSLSFTFDFFLILAMFITCLFVQTLNFFFIVLKRFIF
jgi:hypothetical protein